MSRACLPTIHRLAIVTALVWSGLVGAAMADQKADLAFQQAKQAFRQRDWVTAVTQLDTAVGLAPKDAKYRGLRGVAWLRSGNYAKGLADLKAAIELNPGDAGVRYRPSSITELSAAALEHGRRQLAQMLRDRPAMAESPEQAEFLRRWAMRKFAGEDFHSPIDWDPSPPLHSDAEHLSADGNTHAAILVEAHYTHGPKRGQPRSFEELWAGAIYELHNVTHSREFARLNDEAAEGKLSKPQFVVSILRHELLAAQETRAFYVQMFLPFAEKQKLTTDPGLWFCDWWDTAERVLESFPDKSVYPWRPYGRQYDWMAVQRLWHDGRFQKAQDVLEEMRDEEGYEEDDPEIACWLGRCLAKLGKPAEALAILSESIDIESDNPAAYRARGEVYQQLGKKDKADADFARAKQLEGKQS